MCQDITQSNLRSGPVVPLLLCPLLLVLSTICFAFPVRKVYHQNENGA